MITKLEVLEHIAEMIDDMSAGELASLHNELLDDARCRDPRIKGEDIKPCENWCLIPIRVG